VCKPRVYRVSNSPVLSFRPRLSGLVGNRNSTSGTMFVLPGL